MVSQSIASTEDIWEHRLPVERIILHPLYGISYLILVFFICQYNVSQHTTTFDNDIALIRSTRFKELQFTYICRERIIWPACWPNKGKKYHQIHIQSYSL